MLNKYTINVVIIISTLISLLAFQNCGIQKPAVESSDFSSIAFTHTGSENSCIECHQRPSSNAGFMQIKPYAPFDYNTHGATLDCKSCHGEMTELSRKKTDWSAGYYNHAANLKNCNDCHLSQRPINTANKQPHPVGGDCFSCHSASLTLVQNQPSAFHDKMDFNTMWKTANVKPTFLMNDAATDVDVNVSSAQYEASGAFINWSVGSPNLQKLKMTMNHQAVVANLDMDSCTTCHSNANDYTKARFHTNVLTQPTSCSDCHNTTYKNNTPVSFVAGKLDAFVGPAAGVNKLTNPSLFNHAANLANADCNSCHTQNNWATASWKKGVFHKGNNTAPNTCIECHAPNRTSVVTSGGFNHVTMGGMGECATCHNVALTAVRTKTIFATQSQLKLTLTDWKGASSVPIGMAGTKFLSVSAYKINMNAGVAISKTNSTQKLNLQINHSNYQTNCSSCHTSGSDMKLGVFHSSQTVQPVTCKECHNVALEGFVVGGVKPLDHAYSSVSAKDCATCHVSPTATVKAINFKDGVFHSKLSTAPVTCKECHSAKILDQPIWGGKDHSTIGSADCLSCHTGTGLNGTVALPNWKGAAGVPQNYTIPSHVVTYTASNKTVTAVVPGYTAPHTQTNSNCVSCHGTSTNYKTIVSFDHQNLPAGSNTCISCHLGSLSSVSAYIASGSRINLKNNQQDHHRVSDMVTNGVSCVGCHTSTKGANTFASISGVVFPSAAKQTYVNIGCGSVSASTLSCHESGQQNMRVPASAGVVGAW